MHNTWQPCIKVRIGDSPDGRIVSNVDLGIDCVGRREEELRVTVHRYGGSSLLCKSVHIAYHHTNPHFCQLCGVVGQSSKRISPDRNYYLGRH